MKHRFVVLWFTENLLKIRFCIINGWGFFVEELKIQLNDAYRIFSINSEITFWLSKKDLYPL